MKYNIVRFYFSGKTRRKVIQQNVDLETAQKHCNDPATSKPGKWFDGYEKA